MPFIDMEKIGRSLGKDWDQEGFFGNVKFKIRIQRETSGVHHIGLHIGRRAYFKKKRDVKSAGRQMSLKHIRSRLGFQLGRCQYTDVI